MDKLATYSIAELSDEFDVTHRAIRFYEDKGLLHPTRQGRNRVYDEADRKRLFWILRGKRVGFSLDEIGELLDLQKVGDREFQLRSTKQRYQTRIEALREQTQDIEGAIALLEETCETIDRRLADLEAQSQYEENDFVASSTGYGGPITQTLKKW